MQTILVPTDFKLSALDCVDALCGQARHEDLTLVFVHMIKLSDSITDLLMLSRRTRDFELISDAFYEKCRQVKGGNERLTIRIEFFYGNTMRMFKNFLEANDVNYILDPCDCSLSKLHPSSVDPQTLVSKCGLPMITVPVAQPFPAGVIPVQRSAPKHELAEV